MDMRTHQGNGTASYARAQLLKSQRRYLNPTQQSLLLPWCGHTQSLDFMPQIMGSKEEAEGAPAAAEQTHRRGSE